VLRKKRRMNCSDFPSKARDTFMKSALTPTSSDFAAFAPSAPIPVHVPLHDIQRRVIVGVSELVAALLVSIFLITGHASLSTHAAAPRASASHVSTTAFLRSVHHATLADNEIFSN
jgi:hypothetical protein